MELEMQSDLNKRQKNVTWSEKMDHKLVIFSFEDAVIGGKNKDSTWKTDTLKRAARLVERECHYQLKNDNIRSRLKTLRNHWMAVHEAATQSGFYFNFITNCVEAEDLSWVEYIKAHPNAANLREKSCKYYTELCQIFSKDSATREVNVCAEDQSSPRPIKNGPTVESLDADDLIQLDPLSDPFDVNMSTAASADTLLPGSKRACASGSNKKGKKSRRSSNDDEVMVTTCKALEAAAKEIASCFEGPDYSALDAEVEAIEGLSGSQVCQVLEFFATNKDLISVFLGMKQSRRSDWMKGKLGV